MENIELRSEKTRRIISEVPPRLVRTGTLILTIILACMTVAVCTIHYPITIEAEGVVQNYNIIRVNVPYKYIHLIDIHREANITMEGETEIVRLKIVRYDNTLRVTQDGNVFYAYIPISNIGNKVQIGQQASVSIIVADKTLLDFILKR